MILLHLFKYRFVNFTVVSFVKKDFVKYHNICGKRRYDMRFAFFPFKKLVRIKCDFCGEDIE